MIMNIGKLTLYQIVQTYDLSDDLTIRLQDAKSKEDSFNILSSLDPLEQELLGFFDENLYQKALNTPANSMVGTLKQLYSDIMWKDFLYRESPFLKLLDKDAKVDK